MNARKLWTWSLTAALGGFLFGFDTAVISGAEQAIQELWGLNDWWQGVTVATALLGTIVGAMLGGPFGDRLGRKRALAVIGALYLVSALGSALTASWGAFVAFRLLGGLGVGASSVVGPTYITEIAPSEKRGQMVALFQFNVVLGILMAYVSNFLLQGAGWRWMLFGLHPALKPGLAGPPQRSGRERAHPHATTPVQRAARHAPHRFDRAAARLNINIQWT